jgi:hypothetical protein
MSKMITAKPSEAKALEEIIWSCLKNAVARFNKSIDRETLLCPLDQHAKPKTPWWPAANEPAISHRLAFYIECEFRIAKIVKERSAVRVDCEYDRHLYDRKRLEVEKDYWDIIKKANRSFEVRPEDKSLADLTVYPDIIVHERLFDRRNLLVVEVKKKTTALVQKWQEDYDALKLRVFTRPKPRGYGYKIGAWIMAEDNCAAEKRHLRIVKQFKFGNGKAVTA